MDIAARLCSVLVKNTIAKGIYDIWVEYPEAIKVKSGEFVNVKCDSFTLRRPISVCEIDRINGRIRLVIETRGRGTDWLSKVDVGENLDILGPLGNGFNLGNTSRHAVFVGGGIGVPPLLEAAKPFGGNADIILGFRNAQVMILKEDFERAGCHVRIVTDDGSAGEKGLITTPLKAALDASPCDVIFACGPRPMLIAVSDEALKRGIPCFVSMEERMACGIGACLSCACKVNIEGREQYLHVCKNGPVFDVKRIIW